MGWVSHDPSTLASMRYEDIDDTDPEVRRRQIDRFRSMTPTERATLADALSAGVIDLSIAGARAAAPEASTAQLIRVVAARRFGRELADAAHGSLSTAT